MGPTTPHQGHASDDKGTKKQRDARTTWPLAAGLVVVAGLVGILLLTQGAEGRTQTIGEALLTAALVAGPFLWAEWMVNRHESSTPPPENDRRMALVGRDLRHQELDGRDLGGRVFVGCNLSHSRLSESGLVEAVFDRADLRYTVARGADMTRASLRRTNCAHMDLRSAQLVGAQLNEADLRGADLRQALLCDADLRGADLRGADLRGADLDGAQLRSALYSATTLWQGDMNLEAERDRHGMVDQADDSLPFEAIASTSERRTIDLRRGPRAMVAAAVVVAAIGAIAVPRLVDTSVPATQVSGVRLDQPFLQVDGTSDQVRVLIEVNDEMVQQFKTRDLPTIVSLDNLSQNDNVIVTVENLAPSSTIRCELGLGADTWVEQSAQGEGATVRCGARVR